MNRLKKGDDVIVLAGRDKGKRGTILAMLDDGRALVNDVNVVKRHTRGNPQRQQAGGIVSKEAPIQQSNLALFNPTSGKGERIGIRHLADGTKIRYYKSNGENVDV